MRFLRGPILKTLAVPIIHAEIDFKQPMSCGEQVHVTVSGKMLKESEFVLHYEICRNDLDADRLIAKAMTRHVAIDPVTRSRSVVPPELAQWFALG